MKKKLIFIFLVCILLGGFFLRLYRIGEPLGDWHSWRQADTSAVSRNFVKSGVDILHPQFDDLSNVPSKFYENPHGYRFVEFPIYNIVQAELFQTFPFFTLEQWGRLVSIFSSLLISLFLYLLVSKYANKKIGLLAAFFYAFIPYNIYYGRTILPDTTMAMAILGGIYFFDKWIERSSKLHPVSLSHFILALLFTASAFLLKPYALFFTLPMVYIVWKKFGKKFFKQWYLWIFAILSVTPLILWRMWMQQYPEGIPVSDWLYNSNGIRFRPAFFRWILYERITKLISGYAGVIFLVIGFIQARSIKHAGFFYSFFVSSLLFVCTFATGNVHHDYYQILIMPTVAIFCGIGAYYLFSWSVKSIPLGKIILVLALVFSFYFGWQQIRDYFNINNRAIVTAGEAVDTLTPKDAKVVAPYGGDTTLLYQTKRQGWASFSHSLEELIMKGADYLLIVNPKQEDYQLGKKYKIISEAKEEYILFDLTQKP